MISLWKSELEVTDRLGNNNIRKFSFSKVVITNKTKPNMTWEFDSTFEQAFLQEYFYYFFLTPRDITTNITARYAVDFFHILLEISLQKFLSDSSMNIFVYSIWFFFPQIINSSKVRFNFQEKSKFHRNLSIVSSIDFLRTFSNILV